MEEYQDMIRIVANLAQIRIFNDPKTANNDDSHKLFGMLIIDSTSHIAFTLFGVFHKLYDFGPSFSYFGLIVAKQWLKIVVSDHSL